MKEIEDKRYLDLLDKFSRKMEMVISPSHLKVSSRFALDFEDLKNNKLLPNQEAILLVEKAAQREYFELLLSDKDKSWSDGWSNIQDKVNSLTSTIAEKDKEIKVEKAMGRRFQEKISQFKDDLIQQQSHIDLCNSAIYLSNESLRLYRLEMDQLKKELQITQRFLTLDDKTKIAKIKEL